MFGGIRWGDLPELVLHQCQDWLVGNCICITFTSHLPLPQPSYNMGAALSPVGSCAKAERYVHAIAGRWQGWERTGTQKQDWHEHNSYLFDPSTAPHHPALVLAWVQIKPPTADVLLKFSGSLWTRARLFQPTA